MSILDPNTLAAAQAVGNATLADSLTLYSAGGTDNGLGTELTYGLREVTTCRVIALKGKDVSDELRKLNKQLFQVTIPAGATVFLNEKAVITGVANLTGVVVAVTSQTDDLVVNGFTLAVEV